jgi:hypothetical protein
MLVLAGPAAAETRQISCVNVPQSAEDEDSWYHLPHCHSAADIGFLDLWWPDPQRGADGKSVSVPNIHLYQMKDGLIVKHVAVRDDLGMMQQLDILPTVSHMAGDISRPTR